MRKPINRISDSNRPKLVDEAKQMLTYCRQLGLERGAAVWTAYLESTANHFCLPFAHLQEMLRGQGVGKMEA